MNYAEFAGYIGIIPFLFAIYSLFFSKLKERYFFLGAIIVSMVFALPNPISEIPFKLGIPLISSSQPTRLIFIASLSLSVLGAIGFDAFLKNKLKSLKQILKIRMFWIYAINMARDWMLLTI